MHWRSHFFKNGPFPASFSFHLFNTIQLAVNKCSIKICLRLDSNRGPLVLIATALPTEPQPLPPRYRLCCTLKYFSLNVFYFAFYKSAFSSEIIIFKPKVYQKFSKAIKPFRENVCFLKKFKTTLLCRMVFGHHLDTNYCILMAYVWILFYF